MKIKYLLTLVGSFCLLIIYQAKFQYVHSNTFGAPLFGGRGFTNSPFDGRACNAAGCHVGTLDSGPGSVEIVTDIPDEGYRAGQTYEIAVTVSQNGIRKFGFQMTAEDQNTIKRGRFIANSQTRAASDFYVTQGTNSSSSAGNNTKTWSFSWIAPSDAGKGDVTFYAASNAANNNRLPTGDNIYSTDHTVKESIFSGQSDLDILTAISLFPNPSQKYATLAFQSARKIGEVTYSIYSSDGRLIRNKEVEIEQLNYSESLNMNGFSTGILPHTDTAQRERIHSKATHPIKASLYY